MIELVSYHTMQPVAGQPGRYQSAVRVAFVKTGRKWLQVLAIDSSARGGMRLWRVAKDEARYMKPLTLGKNKRPYPISRALKNFRHCAKAQGITKGGTKLLREVARENKTAKTNATPPGPDAQGWSDAGQAQKAGA